MKMSKPPGITTQRFLKIAEWNPANFGGAIRQELASLFFAKLDVIGVVGTAIRKVRREGHVQRWPLQFHHFYSFGYVPSPRVNKSCGGGIMISKKRFGSRPPPLRRIIAPPLDLRGRCGMLEFSGSLRIATGYLYFPPRPLLARTIAAYRQTVDEMTQWLFEALGQLNRGAIPFLCLDLNDSFDKNDAQEQDDYVGPRNHGAENYAAQQLRKFCYEVGLAFSNTFAQHAPAFYPGMASRQPKYPDYIITAADFHHPYFQGATVWTRDGHALQLAHTVRLWDHMPLVVVFLYDHQHETRHARQAQRDKWDKEAAREMLLYEAGTDDFLREVGAQLGRVEERYEEAAFSSPTPDAVFEIFNGAVRRAAEQRKLLKPATDQVTGQAGADCTAAAIPQDLAYLVGSTDLFRRARIQASIPAGPHGVAAPPSLPSC